MKYIYAYKSSDGKRHEASMDAESRESVFETLRKRGIKAIKVVAADGSKANGEIRGVRKRIVVLSTIIAVLSSVAAVAFFAKVLGPAITTRGFESDMTRRQLIGDAVIIEKGVLTGWSEVFPFEGERFFASFAVPGVKAGQRNTTVEELKAALSRTVAVDTTDGLEARQIKSMVEGMKEELRWYVADGEGTVESYLARLRERQDEEIRIYERTKNELENCTDNALREERNAALRAMGLRTIPRRRNSPSDK